jgi:hypothetical protein
LGREGIEKNDWDEKGLKRMIGTRRDWKEWLERDGVGKNGRDEMRFE